MEELRDSGDGTNIDVGAGFAGVSRTCRSVSSESVSVVERGNLTRGCLGGGGSPTRNSSPPSLGERDRGDRADVVEAIDDNRALVLSSCSSSLNALGEIIRRFMSKLRLSVLLSIDMTVRRIQTIRGRN